MLELSSIFWALGRRFELGTLVARGSSDLVHTRPPPPSLRA